jgi:hypothetical protein
MNGRLSTLPLHLENENCTFEDADITFPVATTIHKFIQQKHEEAEERTTYLMLALVVMKDYGIQCFRICIE